MSAADRTANGRSRPGAEQAAAHRALPRVVGVCATSHPEDQPRPNNSGSDQSMHHVFLFQVRRNNELKGKIVPVDILSTSAVAFF